MEKVLLGVSLYPKVSKSHSKRYALDGQPGSFLLAPRLMKSYKATLKEGH